MNAERTKVIAAMIDSLVNGIRVARAHSLDQTASLLEMAKLDLQTELHGITDEELRTFCLTVEAARAAAAEATAPTAERSPNGDWWSPSLEPEAADGFKQHDRIRTRAASRRGKAGLAEAREPLRPKGDHRQSVVGSAHKIDPSAAASGAKHEGTEAALTEIGKLLH